MEDISKIVKEKKLKKGELIAQHSGPVSILKWSDKKRCAYDLNLSWRGNTKKSTTCGKEKKRSVSVLDYQNMAGVNLKDQLLQLCLLERKK
jgi:hypothetical protein